jgi:hypothetical protein
VTGDQGPAEDRIDVAAETGQLLGAPIAARGGASARSPVQPAAEFHFRRVERLHVEWPVLKPLASRTARILDRRGQPIGAAVTLTDRELAPGRSTLAMDLPMGGFPEGDYAVEVTAGAGSETEVQIIAFRVGR